MTRPVIERTLCSHHGDFAHMNRLPACPLCMDELHERLGGIEEEARNAIRQGFLHQHEWARVLKLAAGWSKP